ncbi:hypothetical protein BC939DRAFT_496544 [Gamsiella multidivaricata]|uniref:uncharacterized protein n=1 Tax=Gamsiella multidivaricata TaxID=101098 RepID=UPI00221F84BE|nr:uncharacterized protein BC939DRAFT_496544 [Gamsiella multidivaricata]KAI7817570.1 hypothetical protein BC939DRAFT_496544 [Gamsiella multidivaricata]
MNLAQAVASNDLGLVRELCRNGHDPNQTFACSPRQSAYAVQPIIGQATNFEPDDILYGATPLNLAVLNGNQEIVRALIDAGADLNKKDGRGRTPLLCAVYGLDTLTITPANLALISQTSPAHLSILRNCILPHPSITLSTLNAPQDEIKGITPLCLASYLGKEVVVRCLLEAGKVDVDATDRKGATALMYAVKTLLRHGASPDLTDSNGWSSIQYGQMYPEIVQMFEETLRCKRPEVLHLLTPPGSPQLRTTTSALDKSADGSSNTTLPYALSQSLVRYPLYYSKLSSLLSSLPASQTNQSEGAVSATLGANMNESAEGAHLQQIQRTTHTAMLEAIKLGDFMSLQSLLMAPPSLNDSGIGGGSGSGVGGSLANVALVNHHDLQTGLTPLHHALRTRPLPSMETVKILYQAGADMNAQSHYGRTALHHLCRFSLEHALAPLNDDASGNDSAAGSSIVGSNGQSSGTPPGPVVEEPTPNRKKTRYRTETSGSAGSNHLTPNGKEIPGSSAASTTSSNDLSSTGPRYHGGLMDNGALKLAPPEEIQRASKHLADCCRLLLRLGSLINIPDRHGNTPLHFAVEYGGVLEVVSVLVKEGADIELRNTKGLKPLDVVRGEQSEEMRRILESGRARTTGDGDKDGTTPSNAVVPAYQARDSILKPLNLPETLHEVDFQFNQVLQNLEHYQNHTSVSIETSLQYITDQILLGWSPDNQGANGHGQSQEEYNTDLIASLENLKYELESTYELLMITEEQYRDVITFYESELDNMTRQNLVVLTAYDSEKSKVTRLYSVYTRLSEQLEELEAENEGLKTELEEKKRRGLVSLGRLVHGAMGGEWTGTRYGTSITLAKHKAVARRMKQDSLTTTALDEEQLSRDSATKVDSLPRPAMVLAPQGALNSTGPDEKLTLENENGAALEEKGLMIARPTSPTQASISTESEPVLHTIAVLSQKVSLLEQELSSKTCDIKERDLLVNELTELIQEQSKAFDSEIESRKERIDSLANILRRAEEGEHMQALVDELAVKVMVQEDEKAKGQRIQSSIQSRESNNISRHSLGDWSFLLKASDPNGILTDKGGQDIVASLRHELELSKAQTARLELANASLQDRWSEAMKELEDIRVSEAANCDQHSSVGGTEVGQSTSTVLIDVTPRVTKVFVSRQPNQPQDEPLMLTLDDAGNLQEEIPTLEEIELVFEILMANLAEISRDAEEADLRLHECNRAKEQIYQKCLYLDGLQKALDENVEKIVSRPFKADTQPNFMEEQLKLQNQLNHLMEQAESVTDLYNRLKQDLEDYKEEKQSRLRELDHVRELMRKIGPQELLRGLLIKLEGANPDDPAVQARREAIAAAVAQGMELAAEMAAEESNSSERVASHLWRNSCSVVDEGDMQDAIDSRLSTASIDHYTQSCSISDHKLFIQSLCSTLYALQMTTTHQIVSLKASLAESRASLVLADQELSNLNDQIASLYDDVGTLRKQLRGLQQELDQLIQHRKAEVEKVWEIVGEVKITGNGVNRSMEDDDEVSVSSADTHHKSESIQSRALASSSRYSAALAVNAVEGGKEIAAISISGNGGGIGEGEGSNSGGNRDSVVTRSLSISRAERASVLRRIPSPPVLSENDEEPMSMPPSRASHDFSETSELDRHALISAEMDKLRSVHLHLLSTITEYKKQIAVVKDRNLKLVSTLLDRERVRLWTADGQDEVISAIVGQHGLNSHNSQHHIMSVSANSSSSNLNVANIAPNSLSVIPIGESTSSSTTIQANSNGAFGASTSSISSTPGVAAGAKKHHHLSLTAAEDGIKLLRCQLERIRQCEMARFTDMGVGLTMNYSGLYPSGIAGAEAAGSFLTPEMVGESVCSNGKSTAGSRSAGGGIDGAVGFEATLYSDLENRYGGKGF